MRQWDIQQQVFKTSRLIKHQEYGTYESNRGNISGRPSPSNSTPMTLHQLPKTSLKTHFLPVLFSNSFFHIESNATELSKTSNRSSSH
jgi:hypothetical protein